MSTESCNRLDDVLPRDQILRSAASDAWQDANHGTLRSGAQSMSRATITVIQCRCGERACVIGKDVDFFDNAMAAGLQGWV